LKIEVLISIIKLIGDKYYMFGKKKKEAALKAEKEEKARQKYEEAKKAEREQLAKNYKYAREYDNLRRQGLSDEEAREKLDSKKNGIEVEISSSTAPQELDLEKKENVETKEELKAPKEEVKSEPKQEETKTLTSVKKTKVNEKVIYESKLLTETEEETYETSETVEEAKEASETLNEVKEPEVEVKETKEDNEEVKENKKEAKQEALDEGFKVLVEQDPNDKVNGKYEIFADSDGFKYRLVASNGQIMATSEVYTTVRGARNGIDTLKANLDTLVSRIETDKHKKSQFVFSTVQNKILIHSANYQSRTQAENAINSVKNLVPATKIVLVKEEAENKPELVDRSKFIQEAGKGKYLITVNEESNAYQFILKASNGQVILTSKQYKSVLSCKGAITKFRSEVKNGTFYTVKDKNGQYQFRLYSQANKLVQSGISYSTKAKCISNIESICRFIDSDIIEK